MNILKNWFSFLLKEYGKRFDNRTNPGFSKVGQTAFAQSQVGDDGQQLVDQVADDINQDIDDNEQKMEEIDSAQRKTL